MDKTDLRKYIFEQNRLHSVDEKATLSHKICDKIMAHEAVESANTIVLFWSLKSEVDTHEMVAELVKEKNVILLTQSADTPPVTPPKDAVIIVPGVAFDNRGYRLGRGKGYYDRYLGCLAENYKIGICFPWQMVEKVPTDSHDVCVNEVIF